MTFIVRELPKAKCDKHHIFRWLFERSPQGAAAWLDAYDRMIERLMTSADSFPAAYENRDLELDVKQVLFKTKRGRIYRAVFHIDAPDVFILRIRGPGQAPVVTDDLSA